MQGFLLIIQFNSEWNLIKQMLVILLIHSGEINAISSLMRCSNSTIWWGLFLYTLDFRRPIKKITRYKVERSRWPYDDPSVVERFDLNSGEHHGARGWCFTSQVFINNKWPDNVVVIDFGPNSICCGRCVWCSIIRQ